MLITTVLLPFAVQFNHSFKKHEHSSCKSQNIIHFDAHQTDCSVFHFKINHHKVDFSLPILLAEKIEIFEKILTVETQISSVKIQHKASRAPPLLLLS